MAVSRAGLLNTSLSYDKLAGTVVTQNGSSAGIGTHHPMSPENIDSSYQHTIKGKLKLKLGRKCKL